MERRAAREAKGQDKPSKREHAAARRAAGVLQAWHSTPRGRLSPRPLLPPVSSAAAAAGSSEQDLLLLVSVSAPANDDRRAAALSLFSVGRHRLSPTPTVDTDCSLSAAPGGPYRRHPAESAFDTPQLFSSTKGGTPLSSMTPAAFGVGGGGGSESAADLLLDLSGCSPLPLARGGNQLASRMGRTAGGASAAVYAAKGHAAEGGAGATGAARASSHRMPPLANVPPPLERGWFEGGELANWLDAATPLDNGWGTPSTAGFPTLEHGWGSLGNRRGWGAPAPLVPPDAYASLASITPDHGKRKWAPTDVPVSDGELGATAKVARQLLVLCS